MADAITPNTIALVASAVNFPYGTIDPIDEIGALAQKHRHRPARRRLPGRILPPLGREARGTPCRRSTFACPGVTSMSCDTHKYGYAPKGTSVVLYRGQELRRYQYFTWPIGRAGCTTRPPFPAAAPAD